jgi:hypothetical protein
MRNTISREIKGHTKHPILMDTEPSATEIDSARRVREEREKAFNRCWLNPGDPSDRYTARYLDSIKEEIYIRSRALAHQIFEIGKLLVDAKDLLPHGSFDSWIEKNFHFSKRTALNFRRVYTVCMGQPELVEFFKPSILYHLCAPGFPRDLRKVIFDNVTGVYDINQKKLLEVAIKYNKGEIKVDSPEVQSLLKKQKDGKYYERLRALLKGLRKVLENHRSKFYDVVGRDIANPLIDEKHPLHDREEDSFDERVVAYITEGDENLFGAQIDKMIKEWTRKIDELMEELNPEKRKNCENAKFANLENHKITSAQRAEGLRMQTKQAVEEAALAREKRTRGKKFIRQS